MLAQSYKTAEELGLTEKGRDALIRVLGMMDRGELKDTPRNCFAPNGFNMSVSWYENECGTIGCIGGVGWVLLLFRWDTQRFLHTGPRA